VRKGNNAARLVKRLRLRGTIPPFLNTASWREAMPVLLFLWSSVYVTTGTTLLLHSLIHSSMALQPFVGPWPLLQFRNCFITQKI
jgi:hypothetical protein